MIKPLTPGPIGQYIGLSTPKYTAVSYTYITLFVAIRYDLSVRDSVLPRRSARYVLYINTLIRLIVLIRLVIQTASDSFTQFALYLSSLTSHIYYYLYSVSFYFLFS